MGEELTRKRVEEKIFGLVEFIKFHALSPVTQTDFIKSTLFKTTANRQVLLINQTSDQMTVDQSISRVRFSLDNPNDIRQLTTCVAKIKQTIFMNIIKLKERKKITGKI